MKIFYNLKTFNNVFRHSEVAALIDDTDSSILSNITNVTMASLFVPTIATSTGYNLYFNNAFYYPHSGHNASDGGVIGSSGFYVGAETTESFFDDDGTDCEISPAPFTPSELLGVSLEAGEYYIVVDGRHRVVKALCHGKVTIKANLN